jgi:hypothetical protein
VRRAAEPAGAAADDALEPEHVPGVIRNLMDGHYKGVADVRLRIVHADAIAAVELGADQRQASATREVLTADLGAAVDQFAAAVATDAGTLDSAVKSAVETFKEAVASPTADLEVAIAALEEALLAATAPIEIADPAEAAPPPDDAIAAPPDLSADDPIAVLLTSLRDMVEASITAEAADRLLPRLSSYSGEGKAYARFLAIYETMITTAPEDAAPTPDPSIDLSA